MALINCPHCGEPVSDQAEKCPHCGAELTKKQTKTVSAKPDLTTEFAQKTSHATIVYLIGILFSVLAVISVFLPYVSANGYEFASSLREMGVPTFGTTESSLSIFSYAMVYSNPAKADVDTSFIAYAVLIFVMCGFLVLSLVGMLCKKNVMSIVFSSLSILVNILFTWDFTDRGLIGREGYSLGNAGPGLYMIYIFSVTAIVMDVVMIVIKRKESIGKA